ncbi:MAG TPA: hypothetical protein VHP34_09585 [Alphaproteobacteria bacterium]|jgi:hypothetical protein|nr:hypothetical protein [Alphaproteobacteria bacterium]
MPKLEKDKVFEAPREANALSAHFDTHNGDFDTPEEFIRAYLNHDQRAVAALSLQNMEQLRDVLEKMHPEIREDMKRETTTPQEMKKYLEQLADPSTPKPVA